MAKHNLTSALLSAVIGSLAAFSACLIFFFFVYKPAQPVDAKPPPVESPAPAPTDEIPNPEIMASDVTAVSIKTIYKGYFDVGDRCAKSYNEYFGNDDGIFSPSSPCTILMTFDRDGRAARSVEIDRWDKTSSSKKLVEKIESTADV